MLVVDGWVGVQMGGDSRFLGEWVVGHMLPLVWVGRGCSFLGEWVVGHMLPLLGRLRF